MTRRHATLLLALYLAIITWAVATTPSAHGTTCTPHGQAGDGTHITLCLTRLGHESCRLIFKVTHPDGRKEKIGGIVRCGGRVGYRSDPGDRRPK